MRIPWNLAVSFSLVWAVGALLAFAWAEATGDFTALSGSAGASSQLLDAQLSPSNVVLNDPSLGEGVSAVNAQFGFLLAASRWATYAIRSLSLQYDFLGTNSWVITMRWIVLAFAAPFAINLALIGSEILANMSRGIASIAIPFLRR